MGGIVALFCVGSIAGSIIGYFFTATVLLLISLACFIWVYVAAKDEVTTSRGTGSILLFMVVSAFLIGLVVGMWATSIVVNWNFLLSETSSLWTTLRPHIFR